MEKEREEGRRGGREGEHPKAKPPMSGYLIILEVFIVMCQSTHTNVCIYAEVCRHTNIDATYIFHSNL